MIWMISDPHGGENVNGFRRFLEMRREEDLLFILGDLGLRFRDTEENRSFDRWFQSLKIPMVVVDGNHENFPYLYSLPQEPWCGGTVYRLSETAVLLRRGDLYTVEGKTFLTMGGCRSSAKWKEMGLWHPEEDPNEEEISNAYRNLERCGNRVDYILTHKYEDFRGRDLGDRGAMTLEGLTKFMDENVTFRHWYAGHGHVHQAVDDRHTWLYDRPVRLE